MATLIENTSAAPVTLPAPLRGVIPPGGAVVSSYDVATLITLFNVSPVPAFLRFTEVSSSVPTTSGLENPVDLLGSALSNVGGPFAPTDAATKDYVDQSVGGGDVIWEWNGTDTSQFDPVAVASAGQTAALSVSGPDLATNKAFATLDMTSVWAPPGGGAAFRVAPSEGLALPERFRLRFGVSSVAYATTRIGFMFFDPTTWGANLLGGGMTYGNTYIQWIAAVGAAGGAPPFTPQGATPAFASVGTLDTYGGMLCEWDCTLRPGDVSNPPSVACYGNTLGAVNSDGLTMVADRGRLIGDGNLAGAVPAAFNAASLTGLAIVSNSVLAGAAAGKISRLQILQAV